MTSEQLQARLDASLRARLSGLGSPLYELKWKTWDMELGPPICALRASGRRTSGKGFGGWPTPVANDDNKSVEAHLAMKKRMGGGRTSITSLQVMAKTVGWPTPATPSGGRSVSIEKMDATGRTADGKKHTASLEHAVRFVGWPTPDSMQGPHGARGVSTNPNHQSGRDLQAVAGWVTPSARDWKDTPGMATEGVNPDGTKRNRLDQLPRQAAMAPGQESNTPNVSTGKRAQLSPAFSLWLMGFPAAWALCAGAVMPSSRKSRKSL